jgi:hypothetical protein
MINLTRPTRHRGAHHSLPGDRTGISVHYKIMRLRKNDHGALDKSWNDLDPIMAQAILFELWK